MAVALMLVLPLCIAILIYYLLIRWIFSRCDRGRACKAAIIVSAIAFVGYNIYGYCFYGSSTSSTAGIGIMFTSFVAAIYGVESFLFSWSVVVVAERVWTIYKSSEQCLQPTWMVCVAIIILICFGLLIFGGSRRLVSKGLLVLLKGFCDLLNIGNG